MQDKPWIIAVLDNSITAQCTDCHKHFTLPVSREAVRQWRTGTLIQVAMPNLTVDEREVLISGTCGQCFDKLFA